MAARTFSQLTKKSSLFRRIRRKFQVFLRYIKYYSSFNRFAFWGGIFVATVKAPIDSILIFLGGVLLDSIILYYQTPKNFTILSFSLPFPAGYIFIMLGLLLVQRILSMLTNISEIELRHSVFAGSRQDIVEKFSTLNLQEVNSEEIKSDLEKIQEFWWERAGAVYQRIISFGDLIINIIFAFVIVFSFHSYLAILVILIPLPQAISLFIGTSHFNAFVDDISPLILQRSYLFLILIDARTFAERKVNAIHKFIEQRFKYVNKILSAGYQLVQVKNEQHDTVAEMFSTILLSLLKVAVVVIGIAQIIGIGQIAYILAYVDTLFNKILAVETNLISFFDDLLYVEKLFNFLDIKGFADIHPGRKVLPEGPPLIEFENISFNYPETGIMVLKNTNLQIQPGEKIMILGKDGSGKSSILRLIGNMYKLQGGIMRFANISVPDLKRRQVKEKLSIVAEDFARYHMSLKENIILGDPKKKFDQALYNQTLSIVGLDTWAKELGLDHDTITIGSFFNNGLEISSGHWQRIAIARALYRNRDIFIFDQPFAYIDRASVNEIFPKLLQFIGKRTIIMIDEQVMYPTSFDSFYEVASGHITKLTAEQVAQEWGS